MDLYPTVQKISATEHVRVQQRNAPVAFNYQQPLALGDWDNFLAQQMASNKAHEYSAIQFGSQPIQGRGSAAEGGVLFARMVRTEAGSIVYRGQVLDKRIKRQIGYVLQVWTGFLLAVLWPVLLSKTA